MQEWLLAVLDGMRRWALGLGVAGIILAAMGYMGLFQGILAPFEASPFIVLGQAGIVSAIVLFVLRRILRRAAATKIERVRG